MNRTNSFCGIGIGGIARDIARGDLHSAMGLPGAEAVDVAAYVERLETWVEAIAKQLGRHLGAGRKAQYADLTRNQFCVLVMATVLQRDLGVQYNPRCISGSFDARDSRNHFIHGPLGSHGGTCASLPVLYVAVGRRLGFPLYLVQTKEHIFVRWDGDGDRFNIEATARGFEPYDDARYLSFPHPVTEADATRFGFLRNLTRTQEVAFTFARRARVLFDNFIFDDAVQAMHTAQTLSPSYRGAWMVMSMSLAIVARMERLRSDLPYLLRLDLASRCKPRTLEEKWAIDSAKRELRRLHSLPQANGHVSPSFSTNLIASRIPAHV